MSQIYELSQYQLALLEQLANGPGVGTLVKAAEFENIEPLIEFGLVEDLSLSVFAAHSKLKLIVPTPLCVAFCSETFES